MSRTLLSALVLVLVLLFPAAGCSLYVDDEQPRDASIDIMDPGPPEDFGDCNPLAPAGQQGCVTGEKCTWVRVQDTPDAIGKIDCVPTGTVPLGGACTRGPAGETTGYDDCDAGFICVGGTCADICGFDGASSSACASGFNCSRISDTFANGDDDPVAGACLPGCDPLTQLVTGSNPPADCGAGKGCYVLTSQVDTIAVCANAGSKAHNEDIVGPAFANSCVPGAQPRRKDPTSSTVQCGGLCRAVDVSMGVNEASEGGQVTASTTDKDSCQDTWGASPPGDGLAGESCRFWWAREPFEGHSAYSNTLGFCFKHAAFQYDSNGDMTADTVFPRCVTLTSSDMVLPQEGTPDNRYFWCVAEPPLMLAGAIRNIKAWHARLEPRIDRISN